MKRHYKPDLGNVYRHDVRPETAHWKYLSFKVAALAPGQKLEGNTGDEEVVIVPLVGRGKISFNRETHQLGREDLFRELADVVYLPPRMAYLLAGADAFEFAIGGAPAKGKLPALDVAIPLQDGDLVLVHEGYHPVVKAPGTNAYYLNFLAGDIRKIHAINDPHYDWVSKKWDGNPIDIPVKVVP
jgi:5-deoxy-D-glucuronate isomerase